VGKKPVQTPRIRRPVFARLPGVGRNQTAQKGGACLEESGVDPYTVLSDDVFTALREDRRSLSVEILSENEQ
jgi:hypothetical protein